jgi:hypothetical protein
MTYLEARLEEIAYTRIEDNCYKYFINGERSRVKDTTTKIQLEMARKKLSLLKNHTTWNITFEL